MKLFSYHAALAIIVALCLGVLATLLAAETPHGRVAGLLLTAEGGSPLKQVAVVLESTDGAHRHSYGTETNAHGRFLFRHVAVGAYRLMAYTNAHQQPTDIIYVEEGRTTSDIFELKPQQPFLHIFANQQVFTTHEALKLRCHGFVPEDVLTVKVYRLTRKAALAGWHGSLANVLTSSESNLRQANLDTIPELSLVSTRSQPIDKRDVEGVFRQEIPIGPLAPAMYLIALEAANVREVTAVTVTDLGLVVKAAPGQALIYALDIGSGAPVAGAEVEIRRGDARLAGGRTDAAGLLALALPADGGGGQLQVVGTANDSLALAQIALNRSRQGEALRVYTYTDRPVYRPGHTVYYKSLLRELQGNSYRVPAPRTVTVRVEDGQQNMLYSDEKHSNNFGSLSGKFPLSKNALPGSYTLTLTTPDGSFESGFSVAEYRKPEYQVQVTPARPRFTHGETISAEISAQYYYGAPVPKAKVEYYVTRSQNWYGDAMDEWDQDLTPGAATAVAGEDDDTGGEGNDVRGMDDEEGEVVTSGTGITDDSGRLTVHIPTTNDKAKKDVSDEDWRYTIHATVTDASKRDEEGSASTLVTQGDFRLQATVDDWVAKPGQPVSVSIRTLDYQGKPVSAQGTAEFARSEWQDNAEQFRAPVTQSWSTDARGAAQLTVTPRRDGCYRVLLSTRDGHGNLISHAEELWVMSNEYDNFAYPYQDLDVKADKALYRTGETARIMVNTKYAPQTALLTIEGTNLLEHRLVQLNGKSTVINVKVLPSYLPSVHASLCFIKGKHLLSGEAVINVSRELKALRVQITPDKPSYQPGERAVYRINTTTPDGKPAQAEVSLGVVDEAIYAIMPDNTPNIAAFFYPKRADGVQTAFSFPEVYLSGDNKAGSTIHTRRFFPDTSFWNPTVLTDARGNASISFIMPDNLTTWRATARAADLETHVGQATAKTVVNKSFLVRLEAPRFFTQGDRVSLAAVAHNLTDTALDAVIGLDAGGLRLRGSATAHYRIAAGQTQRVEWDVAAPNAGALPVRVWGKAGALSDAMALTLPVLAKGRAYRSAQSGVLQEVSRAGSAVPLQDTVDVPEEIRRDCVPGSQQLTVRLSPSLASSMLASLNYLAEYPYGCAEQTMSSFLPDIALVQLLKKSTLPSAGLKQRLPDMVQAGLLRLYGYQHEDGGWRWWTYDDSDPWMTAYVVYGMLQAQHAGFTVTPRVLDRGVEALARQAGTAKVDPDTRAFMAYVLALAGQRAAATALVARYFAAPTQLLPLTPPLAGATAMPRGSRQLAPLDQARLATLGDWGRSMLALALHALGRDAEGRALLAPLWAHFSEQGYVPRRGERWCAPSEHAAALLLAGSELTPNDPRLTAPVRWLMQQREDDHWYSTRDTAFVLLALTRYLAASHELQPDMQALVLINGRPVAQRHFTAADIFQPEVRVTLDKAALDAAAPDQRRFIVTISTTGTGRLYYTTTLQQVAAVDLSAPVRSSSGLVIERSYQQVGVSREAPDERDTWEKSQTDYASGDIIAVTLTLRSTRHFDYLMVEDMLPAGGEVRDRGAIEPEEWDNWWCEQIVRDDKVGFAIRQLDPGVRRITYHLSALFPGRYTALPPQVYDMYNPTLRGDGVAETITIR